MRRVLLVLALVTVGAVAVAAQGQSDINVKSITVGVLGGTLCHELTPDTVAPNSAKVGSPCDTYAQVSGGTTGVLWLKLTGAATNTGWVTVGAPCTAASNAVQYNSAGAFGCSASYTVVPAASSWSGYDTLLTHGTNEIETGGDNSGWMMYNPSAVGISGSDCCDGETGIDLFSEMHIDSSGLIEWCALGSFSCIVQDGDADIDLEPNEGVWDFGNWYVDGMSWAHGVGLAQTVTSTSLTIPSNPGFPYDVVYDTASGATTVTLPQISAVQPFSPAACPSSICFGQEFTLVNAGAGAETIGAHSGDAMGAVTSLAPGQSVRVHAHINTACPSTCTGVWEPIGGFGVAPSTTAQIQTVTVTLTDAQIKALPTSPLTIVPAPGSGFHLEPVSCAITVDATAGAYTNIDSGAWLTVYYGSTHVTNIDPFSYIPNDTSITTGSTTRLSDLLTTNKSFGRLVPYVDTEGLDEYGPLGQIARTSDISNKPFTLWVGNASAGNFTGGNAANSGVVICRYLVVAD